jgi:hypothetical protein
MFIPDPDFYPSWILDLGFRIKKQQPKREVKKNLGQFSKNYRTFYQKNSQKALKNMVLGSGIRDPGSGKNLFRIQGSKRHRIPDPGSGSATLSKSNERNNLGRKKVF